MGKYKKRRWSEIKEKRILKEKIIINRDVKEKKAEKGKIKKTERKQKKEMKRNYSKGNREGIKTEK